jgi:hypothetical protein
MFHVKVEKLHSIIDVHVEGVIHMEEMTQTVNQLKAATLALKGNQIKIKADLRRFKPSSAEVADMIRQVQEFGISNGVIRVAEMVESEILALQMNRVARESGTHKILQRFADENEAREWLINGEVAGKSRRF